jgi:hypothetical protein
MASDPVTPESLLTEIVAQLNIVADWAQATRSAADLGEHAEDLCQHYRAYAICLFAQHGDVDVFFHWLLHAPIMRRHFLTLAHAQGLTDSGHWRASFIDPVLDAMAARQWKLAADICTMTSPTWLEGFEYEDDFCYADLVRRLIGGPATAGIDDLMARWHTSLEGGNDPRLEVAEALLADDSDAFEASLQALLQNTEAKARRMADPSTMSPLADELPFFPNRWISVEGLALLALAERRGMTIKDDIDACPRPLRPGTYAPFRPLAYPHLGID